MRKMYYKLIFSLIYWCITSEIYGAKILAIFSTRLFSHIILGHRLFEGLAEKGHHIVVLSPYDINTTHKNYRNIFLEDNQGKFNFFQTDNKSNSELDFFKLMNMQYSKVHSLPHKSGLTAAEQLFTHHKVQTLLTSGEKFDAVIVEQFYNDAIKVFCHQFDAPCIALSTIGATQLCNYLVGNPSSSAYVPDSYIPYTSNMSLHQRIINTWWKIYTYLSERYYYLEQHEALIQKYFPGAPHILKLIETQLVLLNSHPSVTQPVSLLPNMIEIGGYHIKPLKNVTNDLQTFLDKAPNGVIYFSWGSILTTKNMDAKIKKNILNTLGKLKQKVLWKSDDDDGTSYFPSNIKVCKWIPQQDVLAHPNIKLFITHGGLLSILETVYNNVPVLGIPIFGDQYQNIKRVVMHGYGLELSYKHITEESLTNVINELLTNDKYRNAVKIRSKLLRDQPMKPLDKAIYWIEHVIRHKDSNYMRSAALDLQWYQIHLLDIALILIIVFIILMYCATLTIRYIFHLNSIIKRFINSKNKTE